MAQVRYFGKNGSVLTDYNFLDFPRDATMTTHSVTHISTTRMRQEEPARVSDNSAVEAEFAIAVGQVGKLQDQLI